MNFVNPEWLWLLLLVPALLVGFFYQEKSKRKRLSAFIKPGLWGEMIPQFSRRRPTVKMIVWAIAFTLMIISMARPQWGSHEEEVNISGLDLVIALDVSSSMLVEDIVPSRLQKAKYVIRQIFSRLGGDRVGLVAFAASAYLASPLTSDVNYLNGVLATLDEDSIVNQGTDIGLALETSVRALDRGAENDNEAEQKLGAPSSRVILLVSDGEDLEKMATKGVELVREAGVRLLVLGVGTENGGPIPLRDETGNLRTYKKNRSGETVISRFHSDDLQKIASDAKGQYWTISPGGSELGSVFESLGAIERTDYAQRKIKVHHDQFQWPLLIAFLLIMFELSVSYREVRTVSTLFLLLLLSPKFSEAKEPGLNAYLENEKGLQAFQDGMIPDAKKHFGNAQADDPRRPKLLFNQGVVQSSEGDFDSAIVGFDQAAKGARAENDPSLEGRALYNKGAALEKKGDIGGAIQNLIGSLRAGEKAKDEQVVADARKKIQSIIQEQQKQKQQQKQQGKNGGQGDDKKEGGGGGGQGDDKKEEKDPKQFARPEPKKDQFKSQKLSKDAAERVMAELSNREKELSQKLRKQQGKVERDGNDW